VTVRAGYTLFHELPVLVIMLAIPFINRDDRQGVLTVKGLAAHNAIRAEPEAPAVKYKYE
jgi:hypothetical protein